MEVSFKLAEPQDSDAVIELMREFYEVDHLVFDEQIARSALEQLMSDEALGRAWLILGGGYTIGYVVLTFCFSLEFGGRAAIVDELYVRTSHQRKGVGTKALEFLEGFCVSSGIRTLHLEVDKGNTAGQALYQKSGFEDRNNYYLSKWVLK